MPVDLNSINPGTNASSSCAVGCAASPSRRSCAALLQFCLKHLDAPTFDAGLANVPQRDPADWAWLKNVLENVESAEVHSHRVVAQRLFFVFGSASWSLLSLRIASGFRIRLSRSPRARRAWRNAWRRSCTTSTATTPVEAAR